MASFLDSTGLAHLWDKVKSLIPTKTSELTNDSGYVTDVSNKMDRANPTGTGYFSLNRKSSSTIGNYSVAAGSGTTASGAYSCAVGSGTVASGDYSHA